jgi:stearoyl-CoA desaturase (delta-9 desaturase)
MTAIEPPAARAAPESAVVVSPPPARLRIIRMVAIAVVVGPVLGTLLAVALASRTGGVHPAALLAAAVAYALSTLGVTIGFHRYFAHRAFRTGLLMQAVFVILGSCALQGPLLFWVATHRRHHQFSDTPDDPHSPHYRDAHPIGGWPGFAHSHLGWMFSASLTNAIRFAPDIIRDRRIFELQRHYVVWALLGLALPPASVGLATGDAWAAAQAFLWAGPVRMLLVHHASWAVGSLSHMYGARPFDTGDRSANNYWVAVFAFGEGLQNNHHAFPRAAHHGLFPGEPDLSGLAIDGLEAIGLVTDVRRPSADAIAARRRRPGAT